MIRAFIIMVFCLLAAPAFPYGEEAKEEIFPSTPEQVATLSSEPSYLVGGIVSPLSGSPTLRQTDFIVKGAQGLTLSRTYVSPHMPVRFADEKKYQEEWEKHFLHGHLAKYYKGWQFYPHLKLQLTPSNQQVLVTSPNGSTLAFSLRGSGRTAAKLTGKPYGLSNCAGETPSGANDPRNTRIACSDDGRQITVYGTDNATRIYRFNGWDSDTTQLYLLEREILPNGKILKYHYKNLQPSHVESLDPKERFVYASISIEGSSWEKHCHFSSSTGQTADYEYQIRKDYAKAKKTTKKRWFGENDEIKRKGPLVYPPILSKVSSPNFRSERSEHCGRFLLNSYEGKEHQFQLAHRGYGEDPKHSRVHQLSLPVGKDDTFVPIYELSYSPPVAGEKKGKTIVKASDGTSTIYYFSKNLLTSKIQYLEKDGTLKKEKLFTWDNNHWLRSLTLRDGKKNLLYKRSFEYDRFGNPVLETFTGDLSGAGTIESTWTQRIFSRDGKNLLLQEETENGKVTCLSYLEGTNLITSKLIKDGTTTICREFWSYDDCNNLIEKVSEDARSNERHKTTYLLRQSAPFLHMPEWVIETYHDSNTEKLLKKSHLIYDTCGNVIQENIYDAEGSLAYTIEKTYNERGDLLSETNRLGQKATYTYDAKGRRITESNLSGRVHKAMSYDTRGRLCKILEEGDDGNLHTTSTKYDFHDRLIERQDPFGNRTHYKHDPLVGKISQTDFPDIASPSGEAKKVATFSSYDPFGRELTYTDPNGNQTTYSYNAYGAPAEIQHPGGGKETFRYAKNGDLISHTDPDGQTITYENDILGRTLKKTYLSKEGTILAEETFSYNGFHLIQETDKEGQETLYTYDGAGRKVRAEFCGRVTEFAYDPLGRLATTCKHNGDNTLITHYERDLEDKVTAEKKTDLSRQILYQTKFSYDSDGNRASITRHINGEEATHTFTYDAFQRQICSKDALGYETLTSYNENHTNALGQKVLQTKTEDPEGIATITTQDAHGQNVRVEKLGPCGQTISLYETAYDPQGNPILHRDHLYEKSKFQSAQEVAYSYTPEHEIKSLIRGYGTQDARETRYSYSPAGKMTKKTLPDGITLSYHYNPLGYLARIDSSDGEIAHHFTYSKLGYLQTAVDEKNNLTIERELDPFGNITHELFPHGAKVTKTYDKFSRPLSITIAGHGQIQYTYSPLYLKEVQRTSPQGNVYKHTFDKYDLDGNLTQERLIKDLGITAHTTDARGQKLRITNPYFSQTCTYNSVQNLTSSTIDGVESRYQYDQTSQMIQEKGPQNITYINDSLHNRTQKNDNPHNINALNELLSDGTTAYTYNKRGNQIRKKTDTEQRSLTYDPLNQLTEVRTPKQTTKCIYDPLGRRLTKTITNKTENGWTKKNHEHYIYDGEQEIGSFKSPNTLENFRVLTAHPLPRTIAIEIKDQTFAPLIDVQGNIRRLVDIQSKALTNYDFTAFGEPLQTDPIHNPWQFASKRFDPDLGLIYFGKRYYDPQIGRWITTDPAGLTDSSNLYQFLFNNPYKYIDPDGQFVFVIPLVAWGAGAAVPTLVTLGTYLVAGAATGAIAYGGYRLYDSYQNNQLANASYAKYCDEAGYPFVINKNIDSSIMQKKKRGEVDETLSDNPLNDSNLEDISHPQAREKGRRKFRDKQTGQIIEYDEAQSGKTGHKGHDHYHRPNPSSTGKKDYYLDSNGNPTPKGSESSHLYPPEWVWWD